MDVSKLADWNLTELNNMDWEKYDNLSLEEKETLLSQIKADVYRLEGRIAEKKSIFAYLVNLMDKEQGIYGKKRCIK